MLGRTTLLGGLGRVSSILLVTAGLGCSSDPEPVAPATDAAPAVYDWPKCERVQSAQSLAQKAAAFDDVARREHLAGDGLLRNLHRTEDLSGVAYWHQHPNVILWSGMYLASQAFKWKVTGDAEALDNARIVVDGLGRLTDVTGIPGLYGRSLAQPGVAYDYDGSGSPSWVESSATGFKGWRWEHDVSKDGYDGLMFGYAVALEHFEDEALLQDIRRRVGEIGAHLVGNGLQLIDDTGEVTEHGRLYQSALDDMPGFNALLASSWVKVAADASNDETMDDFYYGCLMGVRTVAGCPAIDTIEMGPYIDNIESALGLFVSSCKENYDNFDMCYQAMYPLLRRETHSALRKRLLGALRAEMFHTSDPAHKSIAKIGNSLFTFMYAALTGDDPAQDPVLAQAVQDAMCTLEVFPPVKFDRAIPKGTDEEVCRSRLDNPRAAEPIPLERYHFDNYLWRLDFFEMQQEDRPEDLRMVFSPEDYLVAYWLGRYHGIIAAQD
jgi:hypothetical protein